MTLLENDVIFAYMNEEDPNHRLAARVFDGLRSGRVSVEISGITLLEMELIYRSRGRESELLRTMAALLSLPNVKFIPLTPEIVITSVRLREKFGLSFFDSHHAAAALYLDGRIISFDRVLR